jgi:mono/diheme cytochrome c family protein/WD40 repeat protein
MKSRCNLVAAALIALVLPAAAQAQTNAAGLYQEKCASCHGEERLGAVGPALLPDNLGRLGQKAAEGVIREGRAATQMPAFGPEINDDGIKALAAFIYSKPPVQPRWAKAEIDASRVLTPAPAAEKPVFSADPLNLFVVVEGGDHHVTILDGDKFEPITRFASRFALHGGPKFTPNGRYVFFGSRDGWVTKYDLWTLSTVAEVRAGINTRNIAISRDSRYIAVANYLPKSLVILSADDLSVRKIFDVVDAKGDSSRVSAVYQAPERDSFIAALKDVPEIWEVGTGAPKNDGESLPLRRIPTREPLDDFFFDPGYKHLIGANRDGTQAVVVNLQGGNEVAAIPLPGMPHLGSGISWMRGGSRVIATPHLREGKISIIDTAHWNALAIVPTAGPGFFMRSHENSPYVWTDSFMSRENKDLIQILDKQSLQIVRTLKPAPGKTTAHVEFDRSGRHALVSVWENDGALIVYDAATFTEVKRLPMSKPVGKYNVYNKITFSKGTSH